MLTLVLIFATPVAAGTTVYVDATLANDCTLAYGPQTRSCGAGSDTAYRTLQTAGIAVQAGDTVLIRSGTYQEPLRPTRSGIPGQYITFRNYPNETAVLANIDGPAIYLLNLSYVAIEGLTVTNVLGWGRLESSTNITIRANRFSQATATGTTGGLKLVKSTYTRVLDNTFDDGNDSLVIQESDRNLVQGNAFTKARHSLLSVRCGNFNVIRNNRFNNVDQKAAEIYDCEAVSDAPYKLDATKHNLFDSNAFTYTKASDRDYRYNAIQYSGQNGIVRRNVFYDNQGGGLHFQVYADEALYNYRHRVYHNTFYNNRCYAIGASTDTTASRYFDNLVKNNLLYQNGGCSGEASQASIGNPSAVVLESNAIVTTPPLFVNEAQRDLRLQPGSPMIDAGTFLTRTVGPGSGTQMPVEDVGYFFDGHGIPGEVGDVIQLEGQLGVAHIVSIDYARNILTLSQSLAWTDRQNLSLPYSGTRPDIGAYELASGTVPAAPSNLTVSP